MKIDEHKIYMNACVACTGGKKEDTYDHGWSRRSLRVNP